MYDTEERESIKLNKGKESRNLFVGRRGTITTSCCSVSDPFPRHAGRPPFPNGPFVQHKWKPSPPSRLGHWPIQGRSLRGSSCAAAPRRRQLDIDVTPVSRSPPQPHGPRRSAERGGTPGNMAVGSCDFSLGLWIST